MTDQDATRTRRQIELSIRDGAAPPVVLVHGVMADAAGWQPAADAIDLDARVVTVNRRGRAPSGPLGDGYSVRTEIDDLHAVLDSLGEGAHLIGHSFGGLVAAETTLERSDVRSLTLYEPVSRPFRPETLEPIRAALAADDPGTAVEIVNVDLTGFSREHVEELRAGPAWPVLCELARPLGTELGAVCDYAPRYDGYARIGAPVTLIVGEKNVSGSVYAEAFGRFSAGFPQARSEVLAGQGHLAHIDAPEQLGRLLGEIVARHR